MRVVTTDEALFHLPNGDRQTLGQYVIKGKKRSQMGVFTTQSHPKGMMAWLGISANGCTNVQFVKPGIKINTKYYINKVLKPMLKEDIPRLYPDGNYLFQQDSAPSHQSKLALQFLREHNVPFITPEEWLPNSPDCAPMDFFFWGYLKRRINKRSPKTINGLKKVIRDEVKKVPQNLINKALKSWSRRCREIYYNRGSHIENK